MRSDTHRARCPRCERTQRVEKGDRKMLCRLCGLPLVHESSKRKPLKVGSRQPRPSLVGFHEAVCADGACALEYLGGCEGRLWGHHFRAKQHLRHDEAAYTDPRNGVALCVSHHAAVEAHRIVCPRPPYFAEFLADYGLSDNQSGEARAA